MHRKNCIAESYALKLDCSVLGTSSVTLVNLLVFQFPFIYSGGNTYLEPVMVRTELCILKTACTKYMALYPQLPQKCFIVADMSKGLEHLRILVSEQGWSWNQSTKDTRG